MGKRTEDRLAELERRIKELEARPPQVQWWPYYVYPPWYAQPYIPPPPPIYPSPYPWYPITTGPNTAGITFTSTTTMHEACGGLLTITQ